MSNKERDKIYDRWKKDNFDNTMMVIYKDKFPDLSQKIREIIKDKQKLQKKKEKE